jgi:hypothetical protein
MEQINHHHHVINKWDLFEKWRKFYDRQLHTASD